MLVGVCLRTCSCVGAVDIVFFLVVNMYSSSNTGLNQQCLLSQQSQNIQYTVHQHLHYTLLGIGSGHRQLIAVHCIAEHA